jgi:hypothetical protein
MKPALQDIEARRPVWQALSDMFLDTDTSITRSWRVQALARSLYSIEELEEILIDEIHPVCRKNLLSIAGEWAGFDPTWLEDSILRRMKSPLRALHGINLGRFTVPRSLEWRATKRELAAIRSDLHHAS